MTILFYFRGLQVKCILEKKETDRTAEEIKTLCQMPDLVETAEKNAKRKQTQKERELEVYVY